MLRSPTLVCTGLAFLLTACAVMQDPPPHPQSPPGQQPARTESAPLPTLQPADPLPPQEPKPRPLQPVAAATNPIEFALDASIGGGSFKHRTGSPGPDGDASAAWFRLRFEVITDADIGGGLALEGLAAERELFTDSGDSDTDTGYGDLFAFFALYLGRGSDLAMPVRIGVFSNRYSIDNLNNSDLDYPSVGARLEVEPELVLIRNGDRPALSLFGQASISGGTTQLATEPATVEADANATMWGFELGGRFRTGGAVFGLGWVFRGLHVSTSDTVNGITFPAIDTEFSGLQFSVGARF